MSTRQLGTHITVNLYFYLLPSLCFPISYFKFLFYFNVSWEKRKLPPPFALTVATAEKKKMFKPLPTSSAA